MAIPDPATTEWVPLWSPAVAGPQGPQGPPGASGTGISDANYWVSTAHPLLTAETDLGALPSGYLKIANAAGVATPSSVLTIPLTDTTGVLPDNRLTANVALKDTGNVFTQGQVIRFNGPAVLELMDTSQPVDAKRWQIYVAGQNLNFQAIQDSGAGGALMYLNRAGVLAVSAGLGATPLNASQLLSGTVPDARLSINVLKVTGGFPGGTTNYLRADGTFAVAGQGTVTGPASSITSNLVAYLDTTGKVIMDSGVPMSQVARLDRAVNFAGGVTCTGAQISTPSGSPSFVMYQADAPADRKYFQIYTGSGSCVMRWMNDAFNVQQGYLVTDYTGLLTAYGDVSAGAGAVRIGTNGTWPSLKFNNSYFTIQNNANTQLMWINDSGWLQLNVGVLRFGNTLFALRNASDAALLTVRDNGEVNCPYFLTIPVGTDRWAPA